MRQLPFLFTEVFQIGIDAANPDIDGLRFVVFNEIELVLLQFIERYSPVQLLKLSNGIQVQANSILRPFLKVQPAFECSLGHAPIIGLLGSYILEQNQLYVVARYMAEPAPK